MSGNNIAILETLPIFSSVSHDKLAILAGWMETRSFSNGEVLLGEGDLGDEMFILLKGEVRISKRTLEDEQYTIVILKEDTRPVFGEFAMLDEDRRSATITAIRPGKVLVLKRADFERFGNDYPAEGIGIIRHLARKMSQELRQSNENSILLFEALVDEVRAKEVG